MNHLTRLRVFKLFMGILLILNMILIALIVQNRHQKDLIECDLLNEKLSNMQQHQLKIPIPLTPSPITLTELEKRLDLKNHRSYLPFIKEIRRMPIVFVGGFYRSGTTLMRAILDVHPHLYCGPETNILVAIAGFMKTYVNNPTVRSILFESGIGLKLVDEATALFMYHIMKYRNLDDYDESLLDKLDQVRLCVKDPDILRYIPHLRQLFPNAKFVHMIRDGRASVTSYIEHRKEPLSFDNFLTQFNSWTSYNDYIFNECEKLGTKYCIHVKYEDLVTKTKPILQRVIGFLNETWTDELLKHEQHFGDEIKVSQFEWSTLQIKKKIYNDSLVPDVWLSKIEGYDASQVNQSILRKCGYDVKLGLKPQDLL